MGHLAFKMNLTLSTYLLMLLLSLASCEPLFKSVNAIKVPGSERPKNFTEFARDCGFDAEEVEVVTEDGYILTLFHIPGKKKPVLLVHGAGDSSNTWIIRGEKSLAIALARESYDVWAANVRGNRYGRKHIRQNPDEDAAFWDYSFHELGFYDWPSIISQVLKETNEKKLFAIGHSQGTSSFFALMSLRPEYNNKVELFIALAPAAFIDHTKGGAGAILVTGPLLIQALKVLGINELLADHNAETELIKRFCGLGMLAESICTVVPVGIVAGFDPDGMEPEFMSLLFTQFPAGVSRKCLEHIVQIFFRKQFVQYNYGALINQRVYGCPDAPEYDLSKVTTKTAIIYGENDQVVTTVDVQRLAKLLPNLVLNQAIEKKKWNHVDFTWSTEADKYLNGHIFKLLKKYDW